MKMNVTKIISVILTLIICSVPIYAHSGRTDSNGGHRDKNNISGLGSYHYHHGYPAHLHVNGVCEYDFDDKTNHSSSNSSSSNSTSSVAVKNEDNSDEPENDYPYAWLLYVIGIVLLYSIFKVLFTCIKKWLYKTIFDEYYTQSAYGFSGYSIDSQLYDIQKTINRYNNSLETLQSYSDSIEDLQEKNNAIMAKIPQNIPMDKNRCVTSEDIPGINTVYITSRTSAMHRYEGCSGAYTAIKTTDAIKAKHKICLKCFFNPRSSELQEIHRINNEIKKLERMRNSSHYQSWLVSERFKYKNALLELRSDSMRDIRSMEYLLDKTQFCDILKNNLNPEEYDEIPTKDEFIQLCHHMNNLNDKFNNVTKQYENKLHKYKKIILFEGVVIALFVLFALYVIINIALM